MIQIKRTVCPNALNPDDPTAAGPKELAKVKAKLLAGEKVTSRDFSAYGQINVREALREMFNGKCAYCESKIAGGQDTDIEHYRPKKGVTEAKKAGIEHPGYWWLAMVWENLVLSCQHCNQSRSQQIIIPDHIESLEELEKYLIDPPRSKSGKLNAFPTENSYWVTGPEGDISAEKPLIINPVDVDPEEHLDWVLFKGASTVRPKNGSPAGEATRKILGLNRRWLEEERRVQLRLMQSERDRIIDAMNNWLTANDDQQKGAWGKMADKAIKNMWQRTEPDQPFAGLARAFLAKVQDEVEAMANEGND